MENNISLRDHGLSVLSKLGLTKRQAQVYMASTQLGKTTAAKIAQTLQIDRSEVYRTLNRLERMFLIQRMLGKPTVYEAFPISETITILLNQHAKKQNTIQAEAKKLLDKIEKHSQEEKTQEESKFILRFHPISNQKFSDAVDYTQMSSDVITNWKLGVKSLFHTQIEVFNKAIERGVEFRYIINIPKNEEIHPFYRNLNNFSVKRSRTVPELTVVITDKKEVSLLIIKTQGRRKEVVQELILTDPLIVAIFQEYFELKWRSA